MSIFCQIARPLTIIDYYDIFIRQKMYLLTTKYSPKPIYHEKKHYPFPVSKFILLLRPGHYRFAAQQHFLHRGKRPDVSHSKQWL